MIAPMSPVWNQPSVSMTASVRVRVEPVPAHHHRAPHEDLGVVAQAGLGAVIGTPSSTNPPQVSERPYASTHRDARRLGACPQGGRARCAADDHPPVLVQRCAGVEQPPHDVVGTSDTIVVPSSRG